MKSFHEGSGRHLYAIPIPFKFTFFGALRENVTISTEGFLSFKDNGAKIDLLKLQQVSALRADFELTKDSDVRYVATDDTLVVEWKDLVLQNSSTPIKQKRYHFQVVLAKNNTVTINYIKIPSDFKENIHDHQITSKDSVIAGMSGRSGLDAMIMSLCPSLRKREEGSPNFWGIFASNSIIEFDQNRDSIPIFGSLRHRFTTTREL